MGVSGGTCDDTISFQSDSSLLVRGIRAASTSSGHEKDRIHFLKSLADAFRLDVSSVTCNVVMLPQLKRPGPGVDSGTPFLPHGRVVGYQVVACRVQFVPNR